MNIAVWIVVAFALGVLFGRLTARGSVPHAGGPTGPGDLAGSRPAAPVASVPMAHAMPGIEQVGLYRITLLDSGPNKINTIKAIREVTRLDLKHAKDVADAAPQELLRVNSADAAQAVVQAFRGVASVRVDGPEQGSGL